MIDFYHSVARPASYFCIPQEYLNLFPSWLVIFIPLEVLVYDVKQAIYVGLGLK